MVFGVPIGCIEQREVLYQVSMIADGILIGTEGIGVTRVINGKSCSNLFPSVGEERISPAHGDTDTACKVLTLEI